MKKVLCVMVVGLMLVASNAFAANYYVGPLSIGVPYVSAIISHKGKFTDNFEFSLANSVLAAGATSIEIKIGHPTNFTYLDITGFTATLYQGTVASRGQQVGVYTNTSDNISFYLNNLSIGSYFLEISGSGVGANGGNYYASLATAPVPLPGAALFLGAGLLGLVGLRRREQV